MQRRSRLSLHFSTGTLLLVALALPVTLAAEASEPVICGGPEALPCGENEYCRRWLGYCHSDAFGVCESSEFACGFSNGPVCSCDGHTYGTECESLIVGVAHYGTCDGVCTPAAATCELGAYCQTPHGTCDPNGFGNCRAWPWSCPDDDAPVCGCDGTTYRNPCFAAMAAAATVAPGPCPDTCPDDPDKDHPGVCGCGVPDVDADGDDVPDCADACPDDALRDGTALFGVEFQVNETWLYPQRLQDVALGEDGHAIIVWSDEGLFGRRFDGVGNPVGGEFMLAEENARARVAMQGTGSLVLVWTTAADGDHGREIVGRRFDTSGTPLSNVIPVNQYTASDQSAPQVATDGAGNFVVVWHSDGQDGDALGVFARRFHADGSPRGDEIPVSQHFLGDQSFPSVAVEPTGSSVIVWTSTEQDGDDYGVYARRFDRDGVPAGDEFPVNTTTAGRQEQPRVATSPSGTSVIVWSSREQDGDGSGVYARRFDLDGRPLGGEFQVNTTTAGDQSRPSVAMDGGEHFLVLWSASGEGVFEVDVYGRRFDAAALPLENEFRVNTFSRDLQAGSRIAADPVGRFAAVWTSWGQDGWHYGVFGRRGMIRDDVDGDGAPDCGQCLQSTLDECCDPWTGTALPIDDGNACTIDTCRPDGATIHDPVVTPSVDASLQLDAAGPTSILHWTLLDDIVAANVYRGTIESAGSWDYDEACLVAGATDTAEDTEVPMPGLAFYYLVSALGRCGESAVGVDLAGEARFTASSCSPP